jgi:hypothetical protein
MCRQEDRANLRTLVSLLKKTRVVELDRIMVTWPILKLILDNPAEFPNIVGLVIECKQDLQPLISRVADRMAS